jgi:peptidoglycan/LPS O-acetylase OafA/YrhL
MIAKLSELMKSKRIPELDGLRAFAVSLVVVYHMMLFAGNIPKGNPWIAQAMESSGPKGVSVFFIISGFIITSLLIREKESTGKVSLSAFYIRRCLRIIPPLAFYLATVLLLKAAGIVYFTIGGLTQLLLGNVSYIDGRAWLVAHMWSLSIEEQYYIVFPVLMCSVLKFRFRMLTAVLAVFYGVAIVSPRLSSELTAHLGPHWVSLAALFYFRYIIVGVLLALHREWIAKRLAGAPILVPLALVVMSFASAWVKGPLAVELAVNAVEPVLLGLFVLCIVENPEPWGMLRWRVVQWLGLVSYSVYLWQQLFTGGPQFYHGWSIAQTPLSPLAILACASLSYYLIERPSIRCGRLLSNLAGRSGKEGSSPLAAEPIG